MGVSYEGHRPPADGSMAAGLMWAALVAVAFICICIGAVDIVSWGARQLISWA